MEIWGFPMDLNRWGAGGALVKMDGFPSGGNSTLVYFSCEDCSDVMLLYWLVFHFVSNWGYF
jgi:predicted enzyme related to lactoylglutathione lyase